MTTPNNLFRAVLLSLLAAVAGATPFDDDLQGPDKLYMDMQKASAELSVDRTSYFPFEIVKLSLKLTNNTNALLDLQQFTGSPGPLRHLPSF